MAAWHGEDTGHEVLAQGSDEPPRRGPRLLAGALAAAALVGGYLVTTHDDGTSTPAEDPAASDRTQDPGQDAARHPAEDRSGEAGPATSRGPGFPVTYPAVHAAAPPTLRQLAGVWLVEDGPEWFSPGEMWMAFHTDGSFAMDPHGALLSDEPWARGRFVLQDSALTLVVEGGGGCRAGDMFVWRVRLLPNGRLQTRHQGDNNGHCKVIRGVWQARPLEDTDMWRVSWRP